MNKLDAEQVKRKAALVAELEFLGNELADAISSFNTAQAEEWEKVKAARDAFNAKVEEADGFRETIAENAGQHYAEKSEKWQDSPAGQRYDAWVEAWSVTLDKSDALDEPEPMPEETAVEETRESLADLAVSPGID